VLEYIRTCSNKTAQKAFVSDYLEKALAVVGLHMWKWRRKFKEECCLHRSKGFGWLSVKGEIVKEGLEAFAQRPKKSMNTHW